jgi:hypothetical protein
MLDQIIAELIAADRQDSRSLAHGARLTWWPVTRTLVASRAAGNMTDETWSTEAAKFEEFIGRAGFTPGRRKTMQRDGRWMSQWQVPEPVVQHSLFEQEQDA